MSFTADLNEIVARNYNGLLAIDPHWERIELGRVATITNGYPFDSRRFSKASGVPLIRIRDIQRDYTDSFYEGDVPDGYWVEQGDLLVGMDGDFNVANWRGPRALLNQRVCKISVNDQIYDPRFLRHALPGYLKAINDNTPSITVKHLSSKTLVQIPLPFPPLAEQKRIADKLDRLLAAIDTCKARLDAIPAILKRFRQSVLAAATSGELTEEWRKVSDRQGAATASTELPPGWVNCSLGQLGELARGKSRHRPRNDPQLYGGTHPFIQTGDVARAHGRIVVHEQTYSELGLQQSRLFPAGSLCITIAANIGSSAVLTYPACFPDSVVGLVVDPRRCRAEYVHYFLETCKRHLERLAPATAQKNINLEILRGTQVRLPPVDEQDEIIRRVDLLLKSANEISTRADVERERMAAIAETLLARSFRGELPQRYTHCALERSCDTAVKHAKTALSGVKT